MEYQQTADSLLTTLRVWDELLPGKGKIRLIACGGTALTLLGYKEATKDIDFLVPDSTEYKRLANFSRRSEKGRLGCGNGNGCG